MIYKKNINPSERPGVGSEPGGGSNRLERGAIIKASEEQNLPQGRFCDRASGPELEASSEEEAIGWREGLKDGKGGIYFVVVKTLRGPKMRFLAVSSLHKVTI